jgi:hypothetical protein
MDALYRDVSSAVEEAGRTEEDPQDTLSKLRLLAYQAAGQQASFAERTARLPVDSRPPRMSEPWFCCAEPTRDQFIGLQPTNGAAAGERLIDGVIRRGSMSKKGNHEPN